ncbi:MAG: 7-cyano-7-deazaguanine synthase QueC [Candidatus Aceula meridiana]|nr:7-cyano-7-deazaguanine synthase QueC [Candidatus Aceula meridiana]
MKTKKAVVLVSGGLDSATTLYYAKNKGLECFCLIFDYGQRHKKEIQKAIRIAKVASCSFKVVKIAFPWKGSALLDKTTRLPQGRPLKKIVKEIPSTYVPSRNIIFLSFAASYAEAIGAQEIFIGANSLDYSGYPDCRPEFFKSFQAVLKKGTKVGVQSQSIKVRTPLIQKTKVQIIRMGLKLEVPYQLTWSCYQGGKRPCGKCDSCLLRQKGFKQLGQKDPLL